jgi:very-short-patch-repair endonuclease
MSSWLEETLAVHIRAYELPQPVRELRLDPGRRFRFDFAWPEQGLAVEVDGGEYLAGRGHHYNAEGIARDREKAILADRLGWTVLHFTGRQVRSGEAIDAIRDWMAGHDHGSVEAKKGPREVQASGGAATTNGA